MSARAYRVAPRRRARGRPASRIHWDKLGRVVLVIVLFGILLSYVNPAVNFIDAWRDSRTQRSELAGASAASAITWRPGLPRSKDSDAAVRAARKLGMVAEGERSYVIRRPPRFKIGRSALAGGILDPATSSADERWVPAFVTAPASERTLTLGAYLGGALELALVPGGAGLRRLPGPRPAAARLVRSSGAAGRGRCWRWRA